MILEGAYVEHPRFGVKNSIQYGAFVKEVSDDATQALCSSQIEEKDEWLPIKELVLTKEAP